MSHPAAWLCTSCGLQLGQVVPTRPPALQVWVPSPLVTYAHVAVTCPRCQEPAVWTPPTPAPAETPTA